MYFFLHVFTFFSCRRVYLKRQGFVKFSHVLCWNLNVIFQTGTNTIRLCNTAYPLVSLFPKCLLAGTIRVDKDGWGLQGEGRQGGGSVCQQRLLWEGIYLRWHRTKRVATGKNGLSMYYWFLVWFGLILSVIFAGKKFYGYPFITFVHGARKIEHIRELHVHSEQHSRWNQCRQNAVCESFHISNEGASLHGPRSPVKMLVLRSTIRNRKVA